MDIKIKFINGDIGYYKYEQRYDDLLEVLKLIDHRETFALNKFEPHIENSTHLVWLNPIHILEIEEGYFEKP